MTEWSKHVHRFAKKHNMSYKQANRSRKCKETYKKRRTSPRRKSPRRKTSPRRRRMNAFEGLDEEDSDIQSDAEDIDPRTLAKIKRGAHHRRAPIEKKKKRQRQADYNSGKLRLDDSEVDFYVLKEEYLDEENLLDQAYFGPIHNTIVGVHNNKDDAEKESERRQRALRESLGSDDFRETGIKYSVWKQPKGTYKLGEQWRYDNY